MKNLLLIASFLFVTLATAQIDSNNNTMVIEAEEDEKSEEKAKLPIIKRPENPVGLTKEKDNLNGISVEKRVINPNKTEEFSMVYKSDLIDPGTIYDKKWAKDNPIKVNENDKRNNGVLRKNLGQIETTGEYVIAAVGDFGVVDGDNIRVYANDNIIQSHIFLNHSFKSIKIKLLDGINALDFQALNQGELGPNTAEIRIYDAEGKVLLSNYWNLKTGGIAKATIVKVQKEALTSGN